MSRDGYEQLTLDLATPRRRRPRRPAHPVLLALRLLVSLLLALGLASLAVLVLPYRTTVAGVHVVVTGSVQPSKRGLSVTSTLGGVEFRHVVAVPVGLHVEPEVDLSAVRAVTDAPEEFADRAQADVQRQLPALVLHFVLVVVAGLLAGALVGGLLVDGVAARFARPAPRPHDGSRAVLLADTLLRSTSVALAVLLVVGVVAAATYQADWLRQYTVTGLLADVAATPDRLAALDARDSKAAERIRAVLRLQDTLTTPRAAGSVPDTAYSVLLISDVHRRNVYPYLAQYVQDDGVSLIIDTGDETLVGNAAELTPDYVASIAAVTARTPMLWVKGNHDSAEVAARMAAIPGVTVLDNQVVKALGLQVYGTPDPRTYGAGGDAGSDDPAVVTRIETRAAADAVAGLRRSTYLDLLLAHEPVEADAISKTLGPTVRAQASGHVHQQNAEKDLQHGSHLRLVEGTTGLGGLLADAGDPMSFSILSVAPDCQFTRIVRYQLADPALPAESATTRFGENSSYTVHYFDRQSMATNRSCSSTAGVSAPFSALDPSLRTLAEWGAPGQVVPSGSAVATPSPVTSGDEVPDQAVSPTATSPATPATPPAP